MPELDAEHRDQIAKTLSLHNGAIIISHDEEPQRLGCIGGTDRACEWTGRTHGDYWQHIADALAPLVAGWLADAWDAGYLAAMGDAWKDEMADPARNPYRGGDDG